ncbi:MAG: hypothetical protein ACTS6P_00705 [Candidatus Hodgkinia cicadicola]
MRFPLRGGINARRGTLRLEAQLFRRGRGERNRAGTEVNRAKC